MRARGNCLRKECRWPRSVDSALRVDIEMFSRGGLAVLDAIEAIGYNTLEHRPSIPKSKQVSLAGARSRPAPVFIRAACRAPRSLPPLPDGWRLSRADVFASNIGKMPDAESRAKLPGPTRNAGAVARASASNFYYAFFMLPQAKRDALCALYAFMRLVDDVSDTVGSAADKQRGLARWRAALDAAVAGDVSGHPILPAFADTIERFHIPPRYFHDLISGAEMDLTVGEYATFDRLREYCYRVAGTVGLTCLHVFGFDDPHAPDLAEKLGIAFQLTNILRDVRKTTTKWAAFICRSKISRNSASVPRRLRAAPLTLGMREPA